MMLDNFIFKNFKVFTKILKGFTKAVLLIISNTYLIYKHSEMTRWRYFLLFFVSLLVVLSKALS